NHGCRSWASQTSQQPRVPPLRSVVADGNTQRLLLPDQHEQPLAPRDACVDQVALQQHIVLRGEWDHHCRELRSLRLVNRDRVSQRNLVQFPEVVLDQSLVEAHGNLLLDGIDSLDDPNVAVEHVLVVVVLRLDNLVADLETPSEPLDKGLTGMGGVQYLLQGCVQFAHAERSTVHRAKNLNVADRVETKAFWNSLLHELDQRCHDLLRIVPLDEMEVGTWSAPRIAG